MTEVVKTEIVTTEKNYSASTFSVKETIVGEVSSYVVTKQNGPDAFATVLTLDTKGEAQQLFDILQAVIAGDTPAAE